jgi:hypothetical protein
MRGINEIKAKLKQVQKLREAGSKNPADDAYFETVMNVLEWVDGCGDDPLQDY